MAEVSRSITIERSPDDVWKLVSDVGAIADWLPGLDESEALDGGARRRCEMAGVGTLIEEIQRNDDATRTLQYTIGEAPFDVERYLATWTVEPDGAGSKVTWHIDVEPAAMTEILEPMAEGSLAALKSHLEA